VSWIDQIVEASGRVLAACLPIMVVLTFTIVVARYLFDLGTIAGQEAVMYLHGTAFMLGFAYALKHNAHVRVDVLASKFSERTRAWIDLGGHLIFLLPVCLCILWFSWSYVAAAWQVREGSAEAGGIPGIYLLKSLLIASASLLLLQGLSESGLPESSGAK
jgi:TRAP-type mannitol/chloroaromatic compound transport system permease small subunit